MSCVFSSEETARGGLEAARVAPRPPFMSVESVELFGVLASASQVDIGS
jgi:hypothetical protein